MGVAEVVSFFLLKKRKKRIPTPINKIMLRTSKPLFIYIFFVLPPSAVYIFVRWNARKT